MDSGNSGSISSSGDEEYDSRSDHSDTFLHHHPIPIPIHTQFGSIIGSQSHPQSSHQLVSSHPSLFDLSSSYLHALSQSQLANSTHNNSFLNLDTDASQGRRSEANCTDYANQSQSLLAPQGLINQCATDPSLQLRSVHEDNARALSGSAPTIATNVVRNTKKRTRASRRAPTTVLTTDTTNFRSMVQEFTGIPAPPFSGSSSSRRLDLLTGSSSLRNSASRHLELETMGAFYPLRPSPQKVHPNPLLLSSSSPSPNATLMLHNNMVDAAIASSSATNINSSSATTTHNSINYQLPPDLGLPYHQPQNIMLSMQNHSILAFHHPPSLHPISIPSGFSAKSQPSLLEDLGLGHGQVNAHHLVANTGVSIPPRHDHVTNSEGISVRSASEGGSTVGEKSGGGGRDPLRSIDGSSYGKVASAANCKLNFSASASSSNLNHE